MKVKVGGESARRAVAGSGLGLGLVLALASALLVPEGRAAEVADPGAAFDAAAALYERGEYSEAAGAYDRLLTNGVVTPAVLFNQGNAWLKHGSTGRAIASYRRAERLAPRDPDIAANLRLARSKVQGAPAAVEGPVARALGRLRASEWALVGLVAVWSWFGLLAIREGVPALRRASGGLSWIVGWFAGTVMTLAGTAQVLEQRETAVICVADAVVRYGPLKEARSAFALPDGAELRITDRKGDWVEVQDGAGRRGWLAPGQAVVLR